MNIRTKINDEMWNTSEIRRVFTLQNEFAKLPKRFASHIFQR